MSYFERILNRDTHTLISRKGWFEDASDEYLAPFGSCRVGTGHIRKTKTTARKMKESIRDLFGRLLVPEALEFCPNDLAVSRLFHR
jgi:hypothetical protein